MRVRVGRRKLSRQPTEGTAATKFAHTLLVALAAVALCTTGCGTEETGPPPTPQPPDDTPGITVSKESLVVTEMGGTDSFTVFLDAQPESNVAIALTSSDTGEVTQSPEFLLFTPENWDTPQSVTATGVDDWLADGDIQSTIHLAVVEATSDPTFADVEEQVVAVTTIDDDLLSGSPPEESAEETPGDPPAETESGAPPSDESPSPEEAVPDDEDEDWEEQVISGELPPGPAPYAGIWEFTMNATAADLSGPECPSTGAVGSSGPAGLDTYNNGAVVTVDLDNQHLIYHRIGDETSAEYQTTVYNFPVQTPTGGVSVGLVHFSLTAIANDYIEGSIHWKNLQGCQGDYPFTMVLVQIELPDNIYVLDDGIWNIEFTDLGSCDPEITGFTSLLSGNVLMSSAVNLDEPDHISNYLDFSGDNSALSLLQDPDSNTYQQPGEPFDLGMPENAMGDVLLDYENVTFTGVIEATATDIGEMLGALTVTGSNGCGFTAQIAFTFIGPS